MLCALSWRALVRQESLQRCSWQEAGLSPVVVERGKRVEERIKDVALFQQQNRLDPESNIQFGEGGAGTFSDGKLNSLIREKDTTGRFVLETFVKFGAPEEILYRNKPHIGTDNLRKIVKNIREYLIGLGAEIRFGTRLDGIAERECEGAAASAAHCFAVRRGAASWKLIALFWQSDTARVIHLHG